MSDKPEEEGKYVNPRAKKKYPVLTAEEKSAQLKSYLTYGAVFAFIAFVGYNYMNQKEFEYLD